MGSTATGDSCWTDKIKFDKEPTRGEGNDVLSRHGRHLLARCDGGASNAATHRNVTGCSTHVPEEGTLTASTMTASRRLVQQKLSRARGADCGRTTQLGKERRGESVGSGDDGADFLLHDIFDHLHGDAGLVCGAGGAAKAGIRAQ